MAKPSILVVDDDPDMVTLIKAGLQKEGYDVETMPNATGLSTRIRKVQPAVILLDLVLPDGDGLKLIGDIRTITQAPIIVVSGKGELVDKVVGLEMGADDYVSKPFQMKELCARVKAQLRRYQSSGETGGAKGGNQQLQFDCWTLDPTRYQLFTAEGMSANLTVKEFKLLHALARSAGRVLTREQLLDLARADDFNVTDRAIDTQITRIRKKIGDDAASPRVIQAIRGAGYMFVATVKPV